MRLLQLGRRQQGQVLIHEDEKAHGDRDIDGCHPSADFELFLWWIPGLVLLNLIKLNVRRETQRSETQGHGMPKRHHAPNDR